MAEQHLGQYSLSVIGGYQLQVGLTAQEFGKFLKTLEAVRQGKKTLWSRLVQKVYNRFVVVGNFCLLGIVLWVIGQLWYNGKKIADFLKQWAFNTSIGTILRAFCCGVAAFVMNPKYSQFPIAKDDVEEGLERQETTVDDIGAD